MKIPGIRYFGFAALLALTACDTEDATQAVVDNQAAAPVYRAWWVATYFAEPIATGQSSTIERSIPATGTAYALLAPGWDPASGTPPAQLVVVQSKGPLAVDRGSLLHIAVSDATFAGSCAASQPLSQADADFITQRIFPGEFTGATYDAETCRTTASAADAGLDAPEDARD